MAIKQWRRSWDLLVRRVEGLTADSSPEVVAKEILSWLNSEPLVIKESIARHYNFDIYTNLDVADYPVCESLLRGVEFEHFRINLIRNVSGDGRSPYMILRGALEMLFLRRVEKECPHCGWLEASVYKDHEGRRLLDVCNQCGYVYFKDGKIYTGEKSVFPTNGDLRNLK